MTAWPRLSMAGALIFCAPAHAQMAAEQPPASGDPLETVIITAERRSTALDATPAAISAFDGARLAGQGANSLADVLNLAPNTAFSAQSSTQIFIRGIGDVFLLAGGDPGVALYADGAYLSDQTSTNLALFDTQRVEILRGPQGALYGRNATGGAVNLVSAPPTQVFAARAGIEGGTYGRKQAEGYVSGPLGGGATAARLSFQLKDFAGYTRNPLAGTPPAPIVAGGPVFTPPGRLDDLRSAALRLQTSSRFAGGHQLRLIAAYYHEHDNGISLPILIDPLMNSSLLFGAYPETDPRRLASQGSVNQVDVRMLQAIYERPLGDSTLSLTAAWRKSDVHHAWDGDQTAAPSATLSFTTASIDRSVDLHATSRDGARLQWLAGLTMLHFSQRQDVALQAQIPLGFVAPGQSLTTALPGGFRVKLGGPIQTRSAAVYADVRYALTPSLALLGGARLNRDTKRADEYQELTVPAFGLSGVQTGTPRDGWTSLTGSAGAEYQFTSNTLGYARLSHGFKSGAVNLGALQGNLVKPEKVVALELGWKTRFLDRRGAFNIALFSSLYKDMQVAQASSANVILANASRAKIHGAEFELQLRPAPAWLLGATLGLMDPTYADFTNTDTRNAPGRAVNVRGNQLAQVSRAQLGLSAETTRSVGSHKLTLRGDYVRRSKVYFTEFNTPDTMQSGYGLLNLAASLRPAGGRWTLYGYVRNAGNTAAYTSMLITGTNLGSARQVTYTPPRLIGIGATRDF
ncbi:TonB-dependent receptor [Duganella sp. FT92W]|uniref:TonB-dependent receptor n=1 Tax=Pseudoduganella rivuli TaxID=2666085 RepID=A0A7X2LQE4_9BURK|nr:TonB-dependent receptor [Pseudoduganella rivuli]MRV71250.1 TonB-dependent receptor [Pseudoduganella rivuli]